MPAVPAAMSMQGAQPEAGQSNRIDVGNSKAGSCLGGRTGVRS